jgi:trigger factor
MNVEVENLPNCMAALRIELPPDRVTQEWNEIVKGYRQVARIPGFRPGKAPRAVIEAKFRKEIQEELTRKLVNDSTKQAIREKGLKVLDVSEVDDVEFTPDRSMKFTAMLITSPEIQLPEYKGIPVVLPSGEVRPEEVNGVLQNLRERHAKFEVAEERPVAMGDLAVTNFSTRVDGQPLLEAIPTAPKRLAGEQNFWVRLEKDALLPGFSEEVVGMRPGETREFDLVPPANFPVAALAGKRLHFQVCLENIQNMLLPELDDSFAAEVAEGFDLEKLKGTVRKQLETDKERRIDAAKHNQIIDYLVKNVECELPQSYVKDETRRIMSEIVEQNQSRGVSEDTLRESGKEIVNAASRSAKDRLKANFILNEIATKEDIKVTKAEFNSRIAQMAVQHRMTSEKLLSELEKRGGTQQVYEELLLGKVLDFVTSNATVQADFGELSRGAAEPVA